MAKRSLTASAVAPMLILVVCALVVDVVARGSTPNNSSNNNNLRLGLRRLKNKYRPDFHKDRDDASDRVTFFVIRPSCTVFNLGDIHATGRTNFIIECEEFDDDHTAGLDVDTYYGDTDGLDDDSDDDDSPLADDDRYDDAVDDRYDDAADDRYDDAAADTNDDGPKVAAAETEVVEQENTTTDNVENMLALGFSLLAALVLLCFCFFCFGCWHQNRKNLGGSDVDHDTKKLIGEDDIDQAHSTPYATPDRYYDDGGDGYHPPSGSHGYDGVNDNSNGTKGRVVDGGRFGGPWPLLFNDLEDDDQWEDYVQSFVNCKAEDVPSNYVDPKDGRPLGRWVSLQRHLAGANELSEEKMDQLTALGFEWQLQDGDGIAADHGIVTDPRLWDQYLKSLEAYKEEYGDCQSPSSYRDPAGRALGKWVHHQRHRAARGSLPQAQRAQLDALGFDWAIHSDGGDQRGFTDEHADEHQTSQMNSVPKKKRNSLFQRLFRSTKEGFKGKKARAGEVFGPDGDDQWDEYVQALMDHQAEYGDCNAPRNYTDESGRRLGEWVSYQRVRKIGNKLPKDKHDELAALGFVWELQPEDDDYRHGPTVADVMDDWDAYMKALAKYQQAHGDLMVPRTCQDKKGRQLGAWVSNVRDVAAQNELHPEKRDELNALGGFNWESHRGDGYGLVGGCGYGRWETYFNALANYKMEHRDCKTPSTYTDENSLALGAWVINQRHRAAQDELPYENRDRLTALGFEWETHLHGHVGTERFVWDKHTQSIFDYKAKYGDTQISPTFEDWNGVGMGSWCMNQRQKATQNQLDLHQREELTALLGYGWETTRFVDEDGSICPAHINVHRCDSATCEACKRVRERKGVAFLPVSSL